MVLSLTEQIAEIKDKIDYLEFYGQFKELEGMKPSSNNSYWSCCCFHEEYTASLQLDMGSGRWTCWGSCKESGDIVDFWMKYYKKSFMQAVVDIAHWANYKLQFDENYLEEQEKKKELIKFHIKLMNYFQDCLKNNNYAKEYLYNRGLTSATINRFKLGYFDPKHFMEWLKIEEYPMALKAKMIEINNDGEYVPATKTRRIIFPYLSNDIPLAFTSRALNNEDMPKYYNFKNTEYFKKEEMLYGIDGALETIKKYGFVFLAEGQFDVIRGQQSGIKNIVGISGTMPTEAQILKLRKYVKKFILLVEDKASMKNLKGSYERIKKISLYSKVIPVKLYQDDKLDLDEYLKNSKATDLIALTKKAKPYNEFVIMETLARVTLNDIDDKLKYVNILKNHLLSIRGKEERDAYIAKISEIIDLPEESIRSVLKRKEHFKELEKCTGSIGTYTHILLNVQKNLIAMLFYDIDVFKIISEYTRLGIEKVLFSEYLELYSIIVRMLNEGKTVEYIERYLESDLKYKKIFIECMAKLGDIIIDEDELESFLLNQIRYFKEKE